MTPILLGRRQRERQDPGASRIEDPTTPRVALARSLEAIKGMGKGIYKDIAVPLIVEFLE